MAEYIGKQAAIEALGKEPSVWGLDEFSIGARDQWRLDVKAINAVPPADVRPVVRGKWKSHPDPNCKEWDVCTACETGCKRRECGTNPDGTDYVTEWSYPYCPNCGADMREVGENG